MNITHGSATGSKHIQRCWHCTAGTARSKLWNINSKTCVTGDCAASACLLKYTGVPFYSIFFFLFPDFNVDLFLNEELTAEGVRAAAVTGAAGHDRELITQVLQTLCWTRAAISLSTFLPAAAKMGSTFPSHCTLHLSQQKETAIWSLTSSQSKSDSQRNKSAINQRFNSADSKQKDPLQLYWYVLCISILFSTLDFYQHSSSLGFSAPLRIRGFYFWLQSTTNCTNLGLALNKQTNKQAKIYARERYCTVEIWALKLLSITQNSTKWERVLPTAADSHAKLRNEMKLTCISWPFLHRIIQT